MAASLGNSDVYEFLEHFEGPRLDSLTDMMGRTAYIRLLVLPLVVNMCGCTGSRWKRWHQMVGFTNCNIGQKHHESLLAFHSHAGKVFQSCQIYWRSENSYTRSDSRYTFLSRDEAQYRRYDSMLLVQCLLKMHYRNSLSILNILRTHLAFAVSIIAVN